MSCKSLGVAIALSVVARRRCAGRRHPLAVELGQDQSGGRRARGSLRQEASRPSTKGSIKFIISGPETVPPFEQLQPVSTGVFQMLFTHAVYHYGTTGIAMGLDAVRGDLEARRKSGMLEAIDKSYQKLGLKLVAAAISATRGYHIVLRAPVSPAGDLQGRKVRGTPSLPHRHQHARGLAGGAAGRRGLFGAGKGRGRRRRLARLRRARHALVRGREIHAASELRAQPLSVPDEPQRLEPAHRCRAQRSLGGGRKAEETWFKEYDRMVQEEEAELIKRGMQITEMGAEQKAKLQATWARRNGSWRRRRAARRRRTCASCCGGRA